MTNAFENKYEVIEKIGEGSFSEVLKVEDRVSKLQYAAKKLKKRFKNNQDVLFCAEIIATQKLCRHPNVLYMLEYIYDSFGGKVVFIFELMDMCMYEYMKLKTRLSEAKVKTYLYQMLKGLEHLHVNGLFHRDIKPENILVKLPPYSQDSNTYEGELVKLADLGSIRGIYSQPPYTEYISTRWYRSPECLLTIGNYGPKMDIWAVGCVFYEMLTMKPLFPGSNEIDQLSRIHGLLGTPSNRLLCKFKKRSKNFENFPHQVGSGLGLLLCNVAEDTQQLLKLMLQYDPEARSNVRRLLENKYFEKLRAGDCFRRYKTTDVKTRSIKKGNGDDQNNYLQYIGSMNNWKSSKFQNTVHSGFLSPKKHPSTDIPSTIQHNIIKQQGHFSTEHAATTGNLHKDYNFPPNINTFRQQQQQQQQQHAVNNNNGIYSKYVQPLNQPYPSNPQHQQKPQHNSLSSDMNYIQAVPMATNQILLGQHCSGAGGGGYAYGYGPPGAQGAMAPLGIGERLRKPVPGALYSRTTLDLPIASHQQLYYPSPPQNHRSNTISTMMKQKPSVHNQQQQQLRDINNNNNNIDNRWIALRDSDRNRNRKVAGNITQYGKRDKSKGSKGSKNKVKSNNSSTTEFIGKGLGGSNVTRKPDKYDRNEYYGGSLQEYRDKRQRSTSGQRYLVCGKLIGSERQQQQLQKGYGIAQTASNPVGIKGDGTMGGDAQARVRHHGAADASGVRHLRKRAASKSPQATPPKQLVGAYKNQQRRVPSNTVGRWSDLKRQSGECHKQLDVAPLLPVCQMNLGSQPGSRGCLYKGIANLGALSRGINMRGVGGVFRKTTSNLPQLTRKPLQPQLYDTTTRKDFQSRSCVLPKRRQDHHKLDTIVELKGRGSRKFK